MYHPKTDAELTDWPHQELAASEIWRTFDDESCPGPICITTPTGGGKSRMMRSAIRESVNRGLMVAIYVHRIQLLLQLIEQLDREPDIDFGVRAASHEKRYENPGAPVQICSLRTEASRLASPSRAGWQLPDADLVLVDEIHQQASESGRRVFLGTSDGWVGHSGLGSHVVGFTATPVGLSKLCRGLVQAGSYSEMRAIGAHDLIHTYGLERPDKEALAKCRRSRSGEYSSRDMARLFRVHYVFGYILDNWRHYNPDGLPTLLYAPDSASSRFFVDHFAEAGVTSASISHNGVAIAKPNSAGKIVVSEYGLDDSSRHDVIAMSQSGEIRIVCNRFILREAIDMPWIYCGILATLFGTLSGYLQSVGRIQRKYPGYERAILLDHGGNYDDHLSPNMNRIWKLGDTNVSLADEMSRGKQDSEDGREPIMCWDCGHMRLFGDACPECGARGAMKKGYVRQLDGTLKLMTRENAKGKVKKVNNADDYLRKALYTMMWSNGSVAKAYGYACQLAKSDGTWFRRSELRCLSLPSKADARWRAPVCEVYSWLRPRVKGSKNAV